ncbi:MAG: hypothetical protein A3G75_03025 [Verrucomicrobia bacterium RIFCSPLOWO2_12_FULL_64_8]|nr:MAG: hypothetical protein A3G75_03025 [Verrucomicrobia bacterium RIFCSPLOWO2_12_FULL_64_8]
MIFLLAVSLFANAGLVAALLLRSRTAASGAAASVAGPGAIATAPAAAEKGGAGKAATTNLDIAAAAALKTLLSGDLEQLVANLRAAGFSPGMIRTIVTALLGEQYAARRRQMLANQTDVPFWKTGSTGSTYTPQQMAEMRAISREMQERMKALLGDDYYAMMDESRVYMRRQYGNLPVDKIEMLQRINSDYSELMRQVRQDSGGIMLPEDREKIALLEKEKRADIAALLTPAEFEEYDLRNSSTAMSLRANLTTFEPTEQEFRTLFKLQREFDEKYNPSMYGMPMTPEIMNERRNANLALKEQIKAALGDQRYAEYTRATDFSYRAASQIAQRLELPKENAVATYELQRNYQERLNAIRTDRQLSPAERTQMVQALAAEANQKVGELLTPRGLEAYKTSGGSWLRNLEMQGPSRAAGVPPVQDSRVILRGSGGGGGR